MLRFPDVKLPNRSGHSPLLGRVLTCSPLFLRGACSGVHACSLSFFLQGLGVVHATLRPLARPAAPVLVSGWFGIALSLSLFRSFLLWGISSRALETRSLKPLGQGAPSGYSFAWLS